LCPRLEMSRTRKKDLATTRRGEKSFGESKAVSRSGESLETSKLTSEQQKNSSDLKKKNPIDAYARSRCFGVIMPKTALNPSET